MGFMINRDDKEQMLLALNRVHLSYMCIEHFELLQFYHISKNSEYPTYPFRYPNIDIILEEPEHALPLCRGLEEAIYDASYLYEDLFSLTFGYFRNLVIVVPRRS